MGSVIGGFQSQALGRIKSMIVSSVCALIAIICIRFARALPLLLVGRFLMGYSGGSERPASSCYTAEICDPDIRKFTGAFGMVLYTIGYAVIYLLGVFLNWRDILSVIIALPIICAIALYACPESPTWLLIKEKPDEAFKSMLRLRGSKEAAEAEIKKLETNTAIQS